MEGLTFCDLAMLYCPTGGGIRTYYDAKMDWFQQQPRHRYVLVVPGARSRTRSIGSSVSIVEARGVRLTRAAQGYRLFTDLPFLIREVLRREPDVLEAGDPWVSGPIALSLRRVGRPPRIVSSFFHSDPIGTYLQPVTARLKSPLFADAAVRHARQGLVRFQSAFDATMVGSEVLAVELMRAGVSGVRCAAFGTRQSLFDLPLCRCHAADRRRLLYLGRLDRDKQADLLIAILPQLLEDERVSVTVAGTGALRSAIERITHPRFRYVGYVADRIDVDALFAGHDILLTTGGYETFGLAALEAAAAGLIVVGPDRGGTAALLSGLESPFTFRAGDATALLAAARAAIAADWTTASRASRNLAARYGTWSESIRRLIGIYEGLVGQVR